MKTWAIITHSLQVACSRSGDGDWSVGVPSRYVVRRVEVGQTARQLLVPNQEPVLIRFSNTSVAVAWVDTRAEITTLTGKNPEEFARGPLVKICASRDALSKEAITRIFYALPTKHSEDYDRFLTVRNLIAAKLGAMGCYHTVVSEPPEFVSITVG